MSTRSHSRVRYGSKVRHGILKQVYILLINVDSTVREKMEAGLVRVRAGDLFTALYEDDGSLDINMAPNSEKYVVGMQDTGGALRGHALKRVRFQLSTYRMISKFLA